MQARYELFALVQRNTASMPVKAIHKATEQIFGTASNRRK